MHTIDRPVVSINSTPRVFGSVLVIWMEEKRNMSEQQQQQKKLECTTHRPDAYLPTLYVPY